MAIISSYFLYSVLCGFVPCDFHQVQPGSSIDDEYYTNRTTNRSGRVLKNPYPIVETNYGAVRGYSMASLQGNQIYAFEGIRFGETTFGENRFRPPIPAKRWTNILPAFKPGPLCLQIHPLFLFRVIGSEDCLFLNIYTTNLHKTGLSPNRNGKRKLPVIIFFHGGAFIFGEGAEYGPAYIVDANVILVTVNYRLGVLGFMSTGDEASVGNYGLKDQALAMKWVHENIEYFGGDPDKVTIMGQSAGAVSVHLHLLSNKTRNYFQAGIALSAGAFNPWALKTAISAKIITNRLARITGCPTTLQDSQLLVRCFRNINPNFLVAHQLKLFNYIILPPSLFTPVIEPKHADAFLSDSPEELYERNHVAKYPFISSLVVNEGALGTYILRLSAQTTNFRRNFDKYLPIALSYDSLVEDPNIITQKIRDFYFGSESPETVPVQAITDICTDRFFSQGIIKGIKSHAQVAPTYSYIFNYFGRFNFWRLVGYKEEDWELSHIEDTFYFFNSTRFYEGFKKTDPEYKLANIMVNLIGNFAWKREPLFTDSNGNDRKIWNAVQPNQGIKFLQIDKHIKMIDDPYVNRTAFWENLGLNDTTPFKPSGRIKRGMNGNLS